MKKMSVALLMVFSTSAFGGDAISGTLSTIHFMSDGGVIAYTDGARSNVPACAATQQSRFGVDATTPAGKVQLSGLLTAYAAGKRVSIVGTGTCSLYSNTETISYFYTVD